MAFSSSEISPVTILNNKNKLYKPERPHRITARLTRDHILQRKESLESLEKELKINLPILEEDQLVLGSKVCPFCTTSFSARGGLNYHIKNHGFQLNTKRGRPFKGGPKAATNRYRQKIKNNKPIVNKVLSKLQQYKHKKYLDNKQTKLEEKKIRNTVAFGEIIFEKAEEDFIASKKKNTGSKPSIKREDYADYQLKMSKYLVNLFEELDVVDELHDRIVVLKVLLVEINLLFPQYINLTYNTENVLTMLSGCKIAMGNISNLSVEFENVLKRYFNSKDGILVFRIGIIHIFSYLHLCFKRSDYNSIKINRNYLSLSSLFKKPPFNNKNSSG